MSRFAEVILSKVSRHIDKIYHYSIPEKLKNKVSIGSQVLIPFGTRKDIGYVIQNFDIDPLAPFLCKDVVMTGRAGKIGYFRFTSKSDWNFVLYNIDLVGMKDFIKRPVGKLSGGEFQKILLARALSQDPKILLLDEPFSNLDLSSRKNMENLLTKIHNEKNITIIMVSHDLDFIPSKCSRVVVLDKGRIVMEGKRKDILSSKTITNIYYKEDKTYD